MQTALEITASGGHNLLLVGPPGTGKTMLATRLRGLLPPLSDSEALEVLVELQTLSLQPELAGRLAKVAQQVERFEFDAALAALLK